MATPLLDMLCRILSSLPPAALGDLQKKDWFGLPQVNEISVPAAAETIRIYLLSVSGLKKRLSLIGMAYCSLIKLNALWPWMLYCVDSTKLDDSNLRCALDTMCRQSGRDLGYCSLIKEPYQYYCFVTSHEESLTKSTLSCFCLSSPFPCVAVYQAPEQGVLSSFTLCVLEQLFGGTPAKFRRGIYPSPTSAFEAARKYYQ